MGEPLGSTTSTSCGSSGALGHTDIFSDPDFCRELIISFWEDFWEHGKKEHDQAIFNEANILIGQMHPSRWNDLPPDEQRRIQERCHAFALRIDQTLVNTVVADFVEIVTGSSSHYEAEKDKKKYFDEMD